MSICSVVQSRSNETGLKAVRLCLLISLTMIQSLRAEDDSTKANNSLNALKQRSAAERWQRVKRQYPAEAASPRRGTPSQLPSDQQRPGPGVDEELPPSPVDGFAIPRLTALPVDDSTDWVHPSRPVALEEETESTANSTTQTRVASSNTALAQAAETPTPDLDEAEKEENSRAAKADQDMSGRSPRTPIERLIGSINPYYDRDRDSDIRKFAVEKAKEFNIDFKKAHYEERSFPEVTLAWEPTNFYYYPLYFSDPELERYGHSYPHMIQPLASIARFGTQFVLIPYQMTITPPLKPEYPLGWYRPGEVAPKLHYQLPLNAHAAAVEAGVVTGLYFLIP